MRFMVSRNRRGRRAAAATELAIALPFLGLIFAVGLDFARIYYATQTLENCAYAGALYASGTVRIAPSSQSAGITAQDRTNAAISAATAEGVSLSPAVDPAKVQVTFANGSASVTVSYDFPTITPILNSSRVVSLTRVVKMRQVN